MTKRLLPMLLLVIGITGLACGSTTGEKNIREDEPLKIGVLACINETEEQYAASLGVERVQFFDTYDSMLMALQSEYIHMIIIPHEVAQYTSQYNHDLRTIPFPGKKRNGFLLLEKNKDLCDRLNAALKYLRTNKVLSALRGKYLDRINVEGMVMPTYKKAWDTLTVAIAGNSPPIDYMSADGIPSGYNVALLSAISSILQFNLKLVHIDSGAQALALCTGKVDIIFEADVSEKTYEIAEGTLASAYYLETGLAGLVKAEYYNAVASRIDQQFHIEGN